MKTHNFYAVLVMFIMMTCANQLTAQIEVEYDSGSANPHVKLLETETGNAFGRLMFKNQNKGHWTVAARDGTAADFNIFYTPIGSTGTNLINIDATDNEIRMNADVDVIDHDLKISGVDPDLILSSSGTTDPAILFGDNGGQGDARIWYDSSDDLINFAAESGTFADMTISGDDGKVGINEDDDLQAQMTIKANAGNTVIPAQLDLFENNNSGNAVLRYRNFTSGIIPNVVNGSFTAEANGVYASGITGAAEYIIRYSEDNSETGKKDILSAVYAYRNHDDNLPTSGTAGFKDERVGIRTAEPRTDLHLIHKSGSTGHGLRIENESTGTWWKMYTSTAGSLQLRNNNNAGVIGTFATNGTYTASDLRLKRDIEDAPYGLSEIMKMNAKIYHYNSDKKNTKKSIGFIAQDIDKISPELVHYDSESDQYSLNYAAINVIAVQAIQEQQDIIDTQTQEINSIKAELTEIKNMLKAKK